MEYGVWEGIDLKKYNRKQKKLLWLLLGMAFLLIIIFITLYKLDVIFVKNVEHGLIVSKEDSGKGFKYEMYIDGNLETFTTNNKYIDLDKGVVDFKHRKNRIVKLTKYIEPVNEKIMSKTPESLELEYSGNIPVSEGVNVYRINDTDISNLSPSSVHVGAKNVDVYKDNKGAIKTIIISGEDELDLIRVGIKNTNFESLLHDSVEFTCDKPVKIEDKKDNRYINVPANTNVTIKPSQDGLYIDADGSSYTFKNRTYILPQEQYSIIKMLSFKRGYGNPTYRSNFEVNKVSNKLTLINEIPIESYLYQVVPSEMPSSFGLEALKAQSVAARTYAVSDLLNGKFAKDGFHVDDSTMSQVYNNSVEDPKAIKAINSTNGLVMKYKGSLIDAKYYSTSHGFGANAGDIWASDGKLPGTNKPYLVVKNFLLNKEEYDLSSEDDAMRFYKDWDIKGYDSNSPYFRWKVSFTKDELENTIEKNLPLVYKDQKNYILTKTKDGFVSKDIPSNPIGNLLDIKVLKRGKGGNIMELLIVGDNGTYKIIKELNVRYVIRPRKSDTGSNKDVLINRIKGDDLKNASMLPSAFFTFDIEKDSDGKLKNVTLYGGGYGHGVGMSQYGAAYLSKEGYPFDKILKTYYKDINIEKIY